MVIPAISRGQIGCCRGVKALECKLSLRHILSNRFIGEYNVKLNRLVTAALALALLAAPAVAHPGHDVSGITAGFMHPLSGIDHVLVMLAVGIFAAQLGGRALYLLPLTFVGVMAIGGAMGMAGFGLPLIEAMIALSVFVMGVTVAMAWRLPVAAAMALVGVFAVFHGLAHGAEMPMQISGYAYGAGFVLATAALHLAGIGLGLGMQKLPRANKLVGVLMTATGIGLLAGWV